MKPRPRTQGVNTTRRSAQSRAVPKLPRLPLKFHNTSADSSGPETVISTFGTPVCEQPQGSSRIDVKESTSISYRIKLNSLQIHRTNLYIYWTGSRPAELTSRAILIPPILMRATEALLRTQPHLVVSCMLLVGESALNGEYTCLEPVQRGCGFI